MAAAKTAADRALRKRGMTEQLQAMYQFAKQAAGGQAEPPRPNSEVVKAFKLWDDLRRRAFDGFAVPEPNWNAPTTDALEKEVQAFVNHVTDAMRNGL
jgi:hypothetical protein